MTSFADLGLPQPLLRTLERLSFTTPTPIQQQAIPLALDGRDILGTAQTGTGKTAAFGLPLLAILLTNPDCNALVITPTRELATQVIGSLQSFMDRKAPLATALIIGGESMGKQLQQLRKQPRLVVGTPGRLNDHRQRGSLDLRSTGFLVLDETDRMLDMGFAGQIENIVQHLPTERQTLLFSATLPPAIAKLTGKYLQNPARVAVKADAITPAALDHTVVHTDDAEKFPQLLEQLKKREGSIVVFVKTKYGTEKMAKRLNSAGDNACAIHGDLKHGRRERVLQDFRHKKNRILVATDVAARGLDIPHIEHVINYDLPQCAEDYIHRIGRTARAGAKGSAVCFVTSADKAKWNAVQRLLDPDAPQERAPRKAPGGNSRKKPFGKKPGFAHRKGKPRPVAA